MVCGLWWRECKEVEEEWVIHFQLQLKAVFDDHFFGGEWEAGNLQQKKFLISLKELETQDQREKKSNIKISLP